MSAPALLQTHHQGSDDPERQQQVPSEISGVQWLKINGSNTASATAAANPQRTRLISSDTLDCFQRASAPNPIIKTVSVINGTNTASK